MKAAPCGNPAPRQGDHRRKPRGRCHQPSTRSRRHLSRPLSLEDQSLLTLLFLRKLKSSMSASPVWHPKVPMTCVSDRLFHVSSRRPTDWCFFRTRSFMNGVVLFVTDQVYSGSVEEAGTLRPVRHQGHLQGLCVWSGGSVRIFVILCGSSLHLGCR